MRENNCFGKKVGSEVESCEFDKIFCLQNKTQLAKFEKLIMELPTEQIELAGFQIPSASIIERMKLVKQIIKDCSMEEAIKKLYELSPLHST